MFSKLALHGTLTVEMGRKTGYDIPAALESGRLHESQLNAMIRRCSTCAHPEICAGSMGQAAPVPEFCKNRSIFSAE